MITVSSDKQTLHNTDNVQGAARDDVHIGGHFEG